MANPYVEFPNHLAGGGYPRDPDLPDFVKALYVSTKNTWQDAENLDDTHGYNSYIWIPEETFRVRIMRLHVYAEKFRAYSQAAAAGGGAVVTSTVVTPNHTHNVTIGATTSTSESAHKHRLGAAPFVGTRTENAYGVLFDVNGNVTLRFNIEQVLANDPWTYGAAQSHSHTVDYGTVTSAAGGGAHSHNVTLPNHTHGITYGIYEEAIAGRTISAILYDPNGVVVHNFGVITTGETDVVLDLTSYFSTLVYGMYRLALTASGRLRARLVFYELCVMYAL